MSFVDRLVRPLRHGSPRFGVPSRLASVLVVGTSSLAFFGCIDHLNNARVRGADEFECKRAEVQVTEVAEHVFVARGCGQVGAYRCEAGLEGGCKKIQGKTGDKYIAMAPEAEPEEGEKPKKKKKASADGEETEKKATEEDGDKPKKAETSDKPKKDDGATSAAASKEEPEGEGEKPKKKKKKKSEDE